MIAKRLPFIRVFGRIVKSFYCRDHHNLLHRLSLRWQKVATVSKRSSAFCRLNITGMLDINICQTGVLADLYQITYVLA